MIQLRIRLADKCSHLRHSAYLSKKGKEKKKKKNSFSLLFYPQHCRVNNGEKRHFATVKPFDSMCNSLVLASRFQF